MHARVQIKHVTYWRTLAKTRARVRKKNENNIIKLPLKYFENNENITSIYYSNFFFGYISDNKI